MTDFCPNFLRRRSFCVHQITLVLLFVFFVSLHISAQTTPNDTESRQRVVKSNNPKSDKKPKPVLQIASIKTGRKSESAEDEASAGAIVVGKTEKKLPAVAVPVADEKTVALEKKAFELINQKRQAEGLPPLVWNEEIAGLARLHSANMAKQNFFSHKGLDGLMVDGRAALLNINDWSGIAENIAFNEGESNPVEAAVEAWITSANHHRNITSSMWTWSGIGIAQTPEGKFYMTQVFIAR